MKIITESGQLNLDGGVLTLEFKDCLAKMMRQPEVLEMTTNELQILGSCLSKMVGESITNKIAEKTIIANNFEAMTDEEFEDYLHKKYGDNWASVSLTSEEFKRVPVMSKEEIDKLLKEAEITLKYFHPPIIIPGSYR